MNRDRPKGFALEPRSSAAVSHQVPPGIFEDVASGAKAERPGLDRMLDTLREGDVVVIMKLSRLGRSLRHLVELVDDFRERGVGFRSLTEGFDTTTAGGRFVFSVMAAMAEFEREIIVERTRSGLAAARARGRVGGRKPVMTPRTVRMAAALMADRSTTVGDWSGARGQPAHGVPVCAAGWRSHRAWRMPRTGPCRHEHKWPATEM